ncbi:MAG: carbon-nitrogen hydrolase family protein [Dehalococcoidia bacterium]|nr:carbon-nitrogen hydrolase family protein [Dehalococcoidia bacterium]
MIPKEYQNYESVVTVGAVNWKGEWGNKEANLEKMKQKVREASQMGINMVCFPELALSGYECGAEAKRDHRQCSMHSQSAETVPGPSSEEMAGLARELGIYVIFGLPEKENQSPGVLYNSAAVVGPEGVLGRYRKLHLAPPPIWTEFSCFKPGSDLPLFETRYGPIGVQICADFWAYPELTRILTLKGARILFVPVGSASSPGKVDLMTHGTAAAGSQNRAYMVVSNFVGAEVTLSYYGHSTIAGPRMPRFCAIYSQGGDAEEIVSATLSFEALANARQNLKHKEFGQWDLIIKGYQEIAASTETAGESPWAAP